MRILHKTKISPFLFFFFGMMKILLKFVLKSVMVFALMVLFRSSHESIFFVEPAGFEPAFEFVPYLSVPPAPNLTGNDFYKLRVN